MWLLISVSILYSSFALTSGNFLVMSLSPSACLQQWCCSDKFCTLSRWDRELVMASSQIFKLVLTIENAFCRFCNNFRNIGFPFPVSHKSYSIWRQELWVGIKFKPLFSNFMSTCIPTRILRKLLGVQGNGLVLQFWRRAIIINCTINSMMSISIT